MKLEFEKMFEYPKDLDSDVTDGEIVKISTWAKEVLKGDYFDKLTRGHSSEMMTAFIDSRGDDSTSAIQLKAGIKALRNLLAEIERLSSLR